MQLKSRVQITLMMAENERIIYQLVHSLSEAVENGINASNLIDCFTEVLSNKEYSEQQSFLQNAYLLTTTVSQEAVKCMNTLYRQGVNTMMDSLVKLSQQQTTPQPETGASKKKQSFTPSEVARILGKGKNTINKYLHEGIIKGKQNRFKQWTISRNALANYLGTDDF